MTDLNDLIGELTGSIDDDKRQGEIDQALAPFGPEGPWKYAPVEERERVRRQIEAEYAQRAGEALFAVEHTARHQEREVESLEAVAMEAPDAEAAWTLRAKTTGVSTTESLQLQILDELRLARLGRELTNAKPSLVRAAYQAALTDATWQPNSTLIRFVEQRHRGEWRGVAVDGEATEAMAVHGLMQDIAAARQSRIPPALKERRARIQQAYQLANIAKARRVRSSRPVNWRVSA
jgi:hypothetical protein